MMKINLRQIELESNYLVQVIGFERRFRFRYFFVN